MRETCWNHPALISCQNSIMVCNMETNERVAMNPNLVQDVALQGGSPGSAASCLQNLDRVTDRIMACAMYQYLQAHFVPRLGAGTRLVDPISR